ncbi:MAG: response regulator transcription factor [Bacteroidales bacterium]|nr:response regulator transcription factor [Bacteroidales bacterium]
MSTNQSDDCLSVIIVDDELFGRENLKCLIEIYCPELEVVGMASSVVEAIILVKKRKPDVVFLDINMPVLDGFDFLDAFENRPFKVVFVTAHNDFGIKAVKAGLTDYILKPINIKELKHCVKMLSGSNQLTHTRETSGEDHSTLIIPSLHGFEVIKIEDIMHLIADGSYTSLRLKDGKEKLVTRTLKAFEDSLPPAQFCRVHKSHLVNMAFIKDFSTRSGGYITLMDNTVINVSRRKTPGFLQKIRSGMKRV